MAHSEDDLPVAIGDVVAGKYRIDSVLGRGGMGVVVAATHLDLEEPRAIKFMIAEARASDQAEERFRREAKASAKLRSEHVVRVHDIGRLESGEPYLVMEHLEGEDLKRSMKRLGLPSVEVALDHILQALEALAEAHAAGIIHRDLKPSNLFVTMGMDGRPCVKLLDFGVSKLTGALAEKQGIMDLTHTSVLLGSPLYMSPEQLASTRDIDARSDVWSMGVILYEMLTGKKPFRGKTVTSVTMAVATEVPRPPQLLRPLIPPALGAVVMRCLTKDRDERYADVAAVAAALAPFAGPESAPLLERIKRMRRQSAAQLETPSRPGPTSSPVTDATGSSGSTDGDTLSSLATIPSIPEAQSAKPAEPPEPGSSTEAGWGNRTGSMGLPRRRGRHWVVGIVTGLALGLIGGVMAFDGEDVTMSTPAVVAPPEPQGKAEATPSPAAPGPTSAAPSSSSSAVSVHPKPPQPAPRPAPVPAPVAQPPKPAPAPKPKDPFGETWR